jgi:RHS repeat-associated protein
MTLPLSTSGAVTSWGSCSAQTNEERGFTGHEMLDEVGLIHMNGRLYDPLIGRFLQADPIIQEPLNSQNYNRYSYVLNNPLVYTDPSGYSFWTKIRKPLAAIIVMIAVPQAIGYMAGEAAAAQALAAGATAQEAAIVAEIVGGLTASSPGALMAGGFAAGGIAGGNIESAILGAFQAAASFGIGEMTGHGNLSIGSPEYFQNVVAHAALGCGMSAAQGGSCKSGAFAGGFSAAAGPVVSGLTSDNFEAGLAGRMAVGCAGSKLGGGSCEAGAITAAFDYLYNTKGGRTGGRTLRSYMEQFEQFTLETQAHRLERDITQLNPSFTPTRASAFGEPVNEAYVQALRTRFIAEVNRVDANARAAFRRDEIQALRLNDVGASGRRYTPEEVAYVRRTGNLPQGYFVHHNQWVSQFPLLAGQRENLRMVTRAEHNAIHYAK